MMTSSDHWRLSCFIAFILFLLLQCLVIAMTKIPFYQETGRSFRLLDLLSQSVFGTGLKNETYLHPCHVIPYYELKISFK